MTEIELAGILANAGLDVKSGLELGIATNALLFGIGLKRIEVKKTAGLLILNKTYMWYVKDAPEQLEFIVQNPDKFSVELVAASMNALRRLNMLNPDRSFADLILS